MIISHGVCTEHLSGVFSDHVLLGDYSKSIYHTHTDRLVLTAMVWYRDLLCCLLNSVLIFIRSTSQRETMILVTTFSFAPLLCRGTEKQHGGQQTDVRGDGLTADGVYNVNTAE